MNSEHSQWLAFATDLALGAGRIITRAREDQSFTTALKPGEELVTSADLAADTLIRGKIEEQYPAHCILSEESSPDLDYHSIDSPLWVIDPIDGTVNFAHGHHMVAVSIGLVVNGKAQVGVVHAPFLQETFLAIRGGGAWLNQRQIQASTCNELSSALIATGFPYRRDETGTLKRRAGKVIDHCRDIRRLGSAALDICWVACGRLDGYYESVAPWDMAAARLVAREAGAHCGHLGERPEHIPADLDSQELLITAPGVYAALSALLQPTDP